MADELSANELALALIHEMIQINKNLESLTNAVYGLPEQLRLKNIIKTNKKE